MEGQEKQRRHDGYVKIARSTEINEWQTPEKRTNASTKLTSTNTKTNHLYSASSAMQPDHSDILRSPQKPQTSSKSRWSLLSSEPGRALLNSSRGQSPSNEPYSIKRLNIPSPNQSEHESSSQALGIRKVQKLRHQATSPQKQNKPCIFQLTGTLLEQTYNQIPIPQSLPADSLHFFSSDSEPLEHTISRFCYDENDSLLQTPEVLECHTVKRERPEVFEQEFESPMMLDEEEEGQEQGFLPRFIDPRMYECDTIREGTEELNLTTEFNKAMHLKSELGTFQLTSNIMMSNKKGAREVETFRNLDIKNSSHEDSNGKVFKRPHS